MRLILNIFKMVLKLIFAMKDAVLKELELLLEWAMKKCRGKRFAIYRKIE